jgi:hypothetical protein
MREELKIFANDVEETLMKHDEEKGDSWKHCNFRYLEEKLDEEYKEFLRTGKVRMMMPAYTMFEFTDEDLKVTDPDELEHLLDKKKKELLDIAAVCMMLYSRCDMKIESLKDVEK